MDKNIIENLTGAGAAFGAPAAFGGGAGAAFGAPTALGGGAGAASPGPVQVAVAAAVVAVVV